MVPDQSIPELETFKKFEGKTPFVEDSAFEDLVVARSNDSEPIHRWFKFKEGFSHSLLSTLLENDLKTLGKSFTLLDPFCGSGTALVSAQRLGTKGFDIVPIGIERNRFVHFVAQSKVRWRLVRPDDLLTLASKVKDADSQVELPELSSISKGRCISKHLARRIVSVCDAIRSRHGYDSTSQAAMLAVASAIEPLSKVRKDGRALRLTPPKKRTTLGRVFRERIEAIVEDCKEVQKTIPTATAGRVIRGDGRFPLDEGIQKKSIDLILTSPPYPNNIDYTEVYKLELWLLRFVSDTDAFYKMRLDTMRSHPIVDFDEKADSVSRASAAYKNLLGPLLKRIRESEKWRARMVEAYCKDMSVALGQHFECLKAGGYEVIVIGNSLHGNSDGAFVIPADLIVCALAEEVGFKVKKLISARKLKRRLSGNHFLRESVIILKKPQGCDK
jgi:hypothetical protein